MNVAILCGHIDSSYARDILQALNAHDIRQVAIVAAAGSNSPSKLSTLWATHGWSLPRAAVRRIAMLLLQQMRHARPRTAVSPGPLETAVKSQGGRFVRVQEINSEDCRQVLQSLQVDLLVLGGTPIVRAPILQVPHFGTLNAHQGALPRFRGMNVIEWAVLEGYPPTISVHFVNAGVDTGDIIARMPVIVVTGDTLDTVRRRASLQQVDLLACTVRAALAGPLPRHSQRPEEGRQYFVMHPQLRAIAEQRLERHIGTLPEQSLASYESQHS